MSLTLAVSDNGDGTGGVATIGGSGGASVSVFSAPYSNANAALTWNLTATRVGDGTVAVAPGTGHYFWYAQTATPGVSNVVNQNLTDSTASVHYRCLAAVQSQIQALALPGLPSGSVQIKWLGQYQPGVDPALPVVEIAPVGKEGQPGILTGLDDIEYPVLFSIVDAGNQEFALNLPRRTLWRQSVFRCFRHQRLSGVPEIVTTNVEPDYVVDPTWFARNYFYSSILFRFRSREPRGFGK